MTITRSPTNTPRRARRRSGFARGSTARKSAAVVQFTELNPHLKERTIAKTEVLHWKGANDDDVEGILYYPLNYEAGKEISADHRHARRTFGRG